MPELSYTAIKFGPQIQTSHDAPTTMKKRCDHDRSATIADSPLSGAHLQDSQWWSSGIYNHAAAVTLGRTWICRGFVATGCMPPAAKYDGGVHDNVDVREPVLVESCLLQ